MNSTLPDATLSTYTAADGENIALHDWPAPVDLPPRGAVLVVHGLGEHAGRYNELAGRLNRWGFAVRGYDQYGHGESAGARGRLPTPDRLADDLADIIDITRLRMATLPLILLGHSLGGLVAARVSQDWREVEGLVLSSPALDAGLRPLKKLLLTVLPRVAPNLTVANRLNTAFLSHDPQVAQGYRRDPLVHNRISVRLGRFIADASAHTVRRAEHWKVPTLLMYAGKDRLVNPAGSRAFVRQAPSTVVTSKCFDDLYHELFNELDPAPVYDTLKQWLDARF